MTVTREGKKTTLSTLKITKIHTENPWDDPIYIREKIPRLKYQHRKKETKSQDN